MFFTNLKNYPQNNNINAQKALVQPKQKSELHF